MPAQQRHADQTKPAASGTSPAAPPSSKPYHWPPAAQDRLCPLKAMGIPQVAPSTEGAEGWDMQSGWNEGDGWNTEAASDLGLATPSVLSRAASQQALPVDAGLVPASGSQPRQPSLPMSRWGLGWCLKGLLEGCGPGLL